MCDAHSHLAQWEKAIPWCQRAAASNPALFWPYFNLSAANAWLGRTAEATAAVAELRRLKPGVTVHEYVRLQNLPDPKFVGERDRIAEGLRRAGLPEG